MATKKEQLQEEQKQILERIDFLRRAMSRTKKPIIIDLYHKKMDKLLDNYNDLQSQIEKL